MTKEPKKELSPEERTLEALACIPEEESRDYRMLVDLKNEIKEYCGDWNIFLQDLKDRLKGRPYIFKLVNRLEDDMERIDKMQIGENKYNGTYIVVKEEDAEELRFQLNNGE
jgi:hypothetical protein